MISVISSPGTETHNDCVSGETFGKRFATSLEVAGLVGLSAPTDPDLLLSFASLLWFHNSVGTTHKGPFWRMNDRFA